MDCFMNAPEGCYSTDYDTGDRARHLDINEILDRNDERYAAEEAEALNDPEYLDLLDKLLSEGDYNQFRDDELEELEYQRELRIEEDNEI